MSDHCPSLLCFDGGGVRGLSSLYLIKQLMESLNHEDPPKPCEIFEMIGGTSTGGLIAIMLGRLEMSVDECIDQYLALSKTVFKREHLSPVKINGRIRARFSTKALEEAIKKLVTESEIIKSEGTGEKALMRTRKQTRCKTFVVAVSERFADDYAVFSSYSRPLEAAKDLFDNATIWEVARATSAASTFFDPVAIGDPPIIFVDGGIGYNNPLPILWNEACNILGGANGNELATRVRVVVSIGTGLSMPGRLDGNLANVLETLRDLVAETTGTARRFEQDHKQLVEEHRYLRLNVAQGLEHVGLEEHDKVSDIRAATMRYGQDPMVQMSLARFARTMIPAGQGVTHKLVTLCDPGNTHMDITENVMVESVIPSPLRTPLSKYYTLGRSTKDFANQARHKLPGCYWTHLTPNSMKIYTQMYQACVEQFGRTDGFLNFETFEGQFAHRRNPEPSIVRQCWIRLGALNMPLNRNHVLAVTYMIHVDTMLHTEHLELGASGPHISDRRRRIIDHFGDWVECHCGCGRKWNYANSGQGMQRDVNIKRKCVVDRWMHASTLRKWLYTRAEEMEADNRNEWFGRNLE